jgi:acetyltransferase-like isoleucine patch superfamily enzyme
MNELVQRLLRRIAYFAPGGDSLRPLLHRYRGVTIGKNVWIGQYVYIDEIHPECITIDDNSTIGIGVLIISHMYWGKRKNNYVSKVHIGKNVFIGPYCVILPETTIGDGSVVQAGTVVSRNVPPQTLWGVQKASAIAKVTIPLTSKASIRGFVNGLRPFPVEQGDDLGDGFKDAA